MQSHLFAQQEEKMAAQQQHKNVERKGKIIKNALNGWRKTKKNKKNKEENEATAFNVKWNEFRAIFVVCFTIQSGSI